jgi:hypothetical protein
MITLALTILAGLFLASLAIWLLRVVFSLTRSFGLWWMAATAIAFAVAIGHFRDAPP